MLSNLLDSLTGRKSQPSYPSAVILVGDLSRRVEFLHIVPEDGTQERLAFPGSNAMKFSYGGSTERSREQLDPILLHVGDGETKGRFLDDVGGRATELLMRKSEKSTPDGDGGTVPTVDYILRSAVVDCSEKRKDRPPPQGATQTYPIYIVHIERSRPGKLINDAEFTSFPS